MLKIVLEKREGKSMIRAGIIGATGYAGGELVRILTGHKDVEIKWYGSRSYIAVSYTHLDDETFDQADFLRRVAASPNCPKSSCPSPQRYMEAYTCEADRVYVVTLSAELSGSYNSAEPVSYTHLPFRKPAESAPNRERDPCCCPR